MLIVNDVIELVYAERLLNEAYGYRQTLGILEGGISYF